MLSAILSPSPEKARLQSVWFHALCHPPRRKTTRFQSAWFYTLRSLIPLAGKQQNFSLSSFMLSAVFSPRRQAARVPSVWFHPFDSFKVLSPERRPPGRDQTPAHCFVHYELCTRFELPAGKLGLRALKHFSATLWNEFRETHICDTAWENQVFLHFLRKLGLSRTDKSLKKKEEEKRIARRKQTCIISNRCDFISIWQFRF